MLLQHPSVMSQTATRIEAHRPHASSQSQNHEVHALKRHHKHHYKAAFGMRSTTLYYFNIEKSHKWIHNVLPTKICSTNRFVRRGHDITDAPTKAAVPLSSRACALFGLAGARGRGGPSGQGSAFWGLKSGVWGLEFGFRCPGSGVRGPGSGV